ncbi:hypothetical protein N7456_010401 [Penicillium angulare]|uniref:Uncharacterized protein n=1 Tax=Penicillium angulare TaxID=116970 RepID=A0A9W9F6T0_9EURO|nr:hypothetical protein N7456_010401 [Penicillium angulare]
MYNLGWGNSTNQREAFRKVTAASHAKVYCSKAALDGTQKSPLGVRGAWTKESARSSAAQQRRESPVTGLNSPVLSNTIDWRRVVASFVT